MGKSTIKCRYRVDFLLGQKSIGTTAISCNCNWSDYDLLLFQAVQYNNIREATIVDIAYFAATTSGTRIQLYDSAWSATYDIYKNTSSSIYVKSSKAADANYGIRIYGFKFT